MDSDLPTPLNIIQDGRYAIQDGWRLDDISLCSSGNIAVSGHNYRTHHTHVSIYGSTTTDDNSDSRDKPTLLYHKQFKLSWRPRYISFMKPNPTEIVTCCSNEVQVMDYNRDVVLRSREVNGWTTCLSVSESRIFIGLWWSDIVHIYDNDLNKIKLIRLKGISDDMPGDIAAEADILCLCTWYGKRAIVYSQDSGSILTEYTMGQHRRALSIAVNIQLQIVAVLCDWKEVTVYSFNNNNCLVVFDVERDVSTVSRVSRVRISDNGRIVTGNEYGNDVKIYNLGDVFVYNLSKKLAQIMSSDEIKELRKHFNVLATEKEESSEHSEDTLKKRKNAYKVLMVLKERGILYPNKANDLQTLFDNLGDSTTSKLSGPIHLYQKYSNIYADIQGQQQPKVNEGRWYDSFSVIPSHEIPARRFPKQDNWQNRNVLNVVNTTNVLVCYIRSGKQRESNVLTQLFKLPNLDSSENPQIIYSKIVSTQDYKKLFSTFIDETHLVMCYNKTLEIIDINSKEVVRRHQLRAAAKTLDVDEGAIFIVVGDSSAVHVFNKNLQEITKLAFSLEDWKNPADMKVTSERLFIICKVKPMDNDRSNNWPDRAMSFRREGGVMEANFKLPGKHGTEPVSIAAHKESEFVGVLWSAHWPVCMVSLYSFSGYCVFLLDVKHFHTIQILNKNTMVVINQVNGLKFYNMAHFFTFNVLALRLSSFVTPPECTGLQNFYGISDDEINRKDSSSIHFGIFTSTRRRFLCLFKILIEKDLVGPCKLDDFIAAVTKVRASLLWSHVENYLKLQDITQRASLKAEPSVQIHVPVTQEGGAESSDNVSCQEGTSAQSHSLYPDQRSLFVECLKKKIPILSEMNYFSPWENFFRWKSTDLFVSCWLALHDRNSMASVKNVEDQCQLKYTEIFTHERLKSETRIIIEGGPGTGKTMLLAQLALNWCQGKIEDVDILIFIPLKIAVDKTLIEAIKEFYIPENTPLSDNDITNILASKEEKICLLLDGLEEHNTGGEMRAKDSSDVRKVIKKEKYPNCKVVVTCRSYSMHDLSDGPLLKIGQFGKTERKSFIEKLSLDNIKKEEKMMQIIEDDSFLLGLCSMPLLFALIVHNIDSMSFAGNSHLDKVAPFVKNMIETLWELSVSGQKTWSESEQLILGELAFNGLCKGQQQFSWSVDFIETKISRLKQWIDSRILVVERDITVHPTEKYQNIAEDYERHDKDEMKNVTEETETSQSLTPAEIHQHKEDRQGRETQLHEATGAIQFHHEIIQKWFAATYLCNVMKYYTDEDQFHEYVIKKLNQLSPKAQHFVLRFTSFLHPRSCHAIINHLLSNFLSYDGSIEPHVMDCICLCFAEHYGIKGTDMKNIVTEVCKEVITIDFEDGRFLQKAKSSLLQYASDCGATIKEIQLRNVISAVDEKSLTLNSGSKLGLLHTLQAIEVSQWEQVLHQDDFENILILLSKGTSIETILCRFPCHPPKILDEEIIDNFIYKNLEVKWDNGEVIWTLDPKKQIFIPIFGTMTEAGEIELKNKEDDFMSHEQFLMSLPDTSTTHFDKWPTKRPLSKMVHPDMKLGIGAKRLKVNWDLKVKREKEYKKEVLDLSKESILKQPSTTYCEDKFVKEGTHSPGVAQPPIKKERSESDFEQKFWTVSPETAHEQSQDMGRYTARKTIITKVGSTLEIPNTGILLVIPPNALPADKEEHEIHMRYIPRRTVEDQVKCFSSNSTAVVEILPSLTLQHPVRLSLPHCLVLQQNLERKAKIFASHHEKGSHPVWEEQKGVSYHVEDTTCIILLNSFSWYKYCIDDEIVMAKKIVVYAAAQETKPHDDVVRIEVGCYPDLPGQEGDISGGQDLIVAHKKILYFVKCEKQHPLLISLNDIFPSGWQCHRSSKLTGTLSKKILYSKISEDLGDSCVFILEKPSNAAGMPLCVFTASQEKDIEMANVAVQLAVNFQVPSTTGVIGHQYESSLKAETTIAKSGGELEIPGTGVVLKIPPSALEGNGQDCFLGMRIISTRIMEDQVTAISFNSCTAVEVYPNTIRLRHPIELRLPHCLTFNENSDIKARIFTMDLQESTHKWKEDTYLQYRLDGKACMIKLKKVGCVKYFFDDNLVKGKVIRVYTAAKKLEQKDEVAELEVGFYSDIPGGGELLRMNPDYTVDSKKKLLFMGKQKSPLQLSLDDIVPSLWECWFPKDKPQNIPIEIIAASVEHSNLFILKKTSNKVGSAICKFTTLPREGPMSLEMALTVCPQLPSLSSAEGQASGCTFQRHEKKLEADSENLTIKLLSRKLTKEWKDVCRSLGVTGAEIYRKEEENKGNLVEIIYQCLLHWKESKGDQATFKALCSALKDNERLDLADDIGKYEELFPKHNTAL